MARAKIAAPIDRPLSKAYLREFAGWSTAYPPGVSDSASLRVMSNCSVEQDGALRIRPGLRKVLSVPANGDIVGEFAPFYTVDGKPALLTAIRLSSGKVGFQTFVWHEPTQMYGQGSVSIQFPGYSEADMAFSADCTYVKYVQIDNKIFALSNSGEPYRIFWVGAQRKAKVPGEVQYPLWSVGWRPRVVNPTQTWADYPVGSSSKTLPVPARANTTSTLISSTAANNTYNYGYFYTFYNEVGESAPSQITVVRAQRAYGAWQGDPSADWKAPDQLVVSPPAEMQALAKTEGARGWNLYMLSWTDQSNVPVEGRLIKTTPYYEEGTDTLIPQYISGWAAHTPYLQHLNKLMLLPAEETRENFTAPIKASNGLVAGDRLVLVNDADNYARIHWSGNQQGEYLNFTPATGGGYKTLTSGNTQVPVAVELWQNPQSVDTITILCAGMHGDSTAYYMNVNSATTTQSQATVIVGFEETTSTQGTVSPYGTEVLNNVLYRPVENNIIKSTASNYNINHKPIADPIVNVWQQIPLKDKRRVISETMDTHLYYLVRSPKGTSPAGDFNGNQIWTCDISKENLWSCWDIVANSIQKMEFQGLLYMSVSIGNQLFVLDPEYDHDDVWVVDGDSPQTGHWEERGIPWEAVTNTQGANRAHDAWAHLQQVNVTFGNFTGECVYGIRGRDRHGQLVEVEKHYVAPTGRDPLERFDTEDFLLVKRDLKEWEFFWRSAQRPKNRSHGSISFIQYRYTPVSVNVGYEYGEVETFEYGNRTQNTFNAVPLPFADTSRP